MIVLTYADDCLTVVPSMVAIHEFVKSMEVGTENFMLTNEVNIDKFLRIEITHIDHRIFKHLQPFLINRIISFFKIDSNNYGVGTNSKSMPVGKVLLHKYLSGKPRKETRNYRTAVGM